MCAIKAKVLLADDEDVFGQTMAELLRRQGFQCDLAQNADHALSLLSEMNHEVLITDIMMPGNDDMGILKQIKQLQYPPAVIVVTGYPSAETAIGAMEKGVFAYKVKPFDLADFIATVHEAARRSRLLRGLQHQKLRSESLNEQMQQLSDVLQGGLGTTHINITTRQYMGTVLGSVMESIVDVVNVLDLMDEGPSDQPVRKLNKHPDTVVYREAIKETVKALEATKNAFKSRELADLRRKLDVLLKVTEE